MWTFVLGPSLGPRQMVITPEDEAYVGVRAHVCIFPPGSVDAVLNTFVLPHVSVIDDSMQVCGMNDGTVD